MPETRAGAADVAAAPRRAPGPDLVVRAADTSDDGPRDAFVLAHPHATFFHRSGWRRFVERVHGHEPRDLVAYRGERLVGVLPLMETRALPRGRNLISVPYGVYGGALGEDTAVEHALLEHARELAEELRVRRLEIRNLHDPGDDGMVESSLYWTFLRELPETPEGVLARMPKKARAEARKARDRHGLELCEGEWYVDDLWRLFFLNKQSLGSPGLPHRHFKALLEDFGRDVTVHIVRHGRAPISAVMSFAFRDVLIAYYAGTAPDADRAFSASNFMYTALQEWAVQRGFRVFDFCRSRAESGAFAFKRHQGFEPRPLHYRYHLVRAGSLPSFTPSNPRTQILRNTWSRLPAWCARRASEWLVGYLP